MGPAPDGIPAFIHPDLFPYGNIADGDDDAIAAAEAWLRGAGCTHARGPLGPTTWHAYRAVVESSGRAPFLGEPTACPEVWEARGYTPCAHYASALAENHKQRRSAQQRGERLIRDGWRIQPLDSHPSFDEALHRFHRILVAAFTRAFAYTPLSSDDFHAMYAPMQAIVDPRLVLTAWAPDGQAAGYCFAIPDHLNPDLETFIIKTLAVDPAYRRAGIGSWLVGTAHGIAHDLGWTAGGIHALMWTDSHSRDISKHAGHIFRRYALFEKDLTCRT